MVSTKLEMITFDTQLNKYVAAATVMSTDDVNFSREALSTLCVKNRPQHKLPLVRTSLVSDVLKKLQENRIRLMVTNEQEEEANEEFPAIDFFNHTVYIEINGLAADF